MTKKEVYRKYIFVYGVATLCWLLEAHEQGENYEECQIIYEVLKDFSKEWGYRFPTRYDSGTVLWLKGMMEDYGLSYETTIGNIPEYAKIIYNEINKIDE